MRCNVDGTDRPQPLNGHWVNDPEWGWVHRSDGWHTVTGTRLKRLQDDSFVADTTHGPEIPVTPEPAFADFVGHPGLPSRAVTLDDWNGAQ
jgi:hypothetical protein